MESILMAVVMGGLGGPVIAWVLKTPGQLKAYEDRKAKFAAGQGKDPDKDPIGPHKSFGQNASIFGVIFGAIGFFLGMMV